MRAENVSPRHPRVEMISGPVASRFTGLSISDHFTSRGLAVLVQFRREQCEMVPHVQRHRVERATVEPAGTNEPVGAVGWMTCRRTAGRDDEVLRAAHFDQSFARLCASKFAALDRL